LNWTQKAPFGIPKPNSYSVWLLSESSGKRFFAYTQTARISKICGAYTQKNARAYTQNGLACIRKVRGVYTQNPRAHIRKIGIFAYTQTSIARIITQTSMCAYTQTSIARIRKPDPVFNVRLRMPVIRTKLGARPHAHVRVPRYWFLRTCMYQSACVWLLKIGC
jgi:hypothetical protein